MSKRITNSFYTIDYDETLSEDGSASVGIFLGLSPSSDVTVTVSCGDQILVNGASTATLTFTVDNWDTAQTITI
nr:hypothetical protein [Rhodospirillales bacterium]